MMILEKWFYFGRSKRKSPAQKQGAESRAESQKEEMVRLRRENQVLRDTLLFYANAKNWDSGYKYRDPDDATIFVDSSESGISVDKGERARQVLIALNKEQRKAALSKEQQKE